MQARLAWRFSEDAENHRHGDAPASETVDEGEMDKDGLIANLVSFNIGVEMGQFLALSTILIAMSYWRRSSSFKRYGYVANAIIMTAGFILVGYQLAGYFITTA